MEKRLVSFGIESSRNLIQADGLGKFQEEIAYSGGIASVVVHPFFQEIESGLTLNYSIYLKRLEKAIATYRRLKLPLIIMEEYPAGERMDDINKRFSLVTSDTFIVETKQADPAPFASDLRDLTAKLKQAGLKKAVVSGSNLWLEKREPIYPLCNVHPLRKKYHWYGCVAGVLSAFNDAGINAVPGFAAYPGRLVKGYKLRS